MSKIIPAILTNNPQDLENKLKQIEGLSDWVQIDIMDGKFVNNTSITLEEISQLEIAKNFSLEAHLMVENPVDYFLQCQKSNIQKVTFHAETEDIEDALSKAQEFDFQIALALNPETLIEKIIPYVDKIEGVLLMSVNPGFQGQKFIEGVLDKIKELKKIAPQLKIEVDGGITMDTIKAISDAGADYLVVGSGLFDLPLQAGSEDVKRRFEELQLKIL